MTGSKKTYPFSNTSLSLRISHFLDVATLFEDLSSLGRGMGEGGAWGGQWALRLFLGRYVRPDL